MKKIKAIAIFLTLVFIALPATSTMGAISQKEEIETTTLEYTFFKSDGSINTKEIIFTKEDISQFSDIVAFLFEKISSKKYFDFDIREIIDDLKEEFGQSGLLSIFSSLSNLRPLQKRVFIMSNGHGAKFDLHFKSDISMRKSLTFWHYFGNTKSITPSKTLIIDPIPIQPFYKILDGWQVGMMSRFIGFYIRIPGNFMEQKQSQTFFFGYAAKVRSIDLPDLTEFRI